MKFIIGVSKTYSNRGNHRHRPDTPRHWHIYGYDFDENGELYYHTKMINPLQVPYYKSKIVRKYSVYCVHCGGQGIVFVKDMSKVPKQECFNGCEKPSLVTHSQLVDLMSGTYDDVSDMS